MQKESYLHSERCGADVKPCMSVWEELEILLDEVSDGYDAETDEEESYKAYKDYDNKEKEEGETEC